MAISTFQAKEEEIERKKIEAKRKLSSSLVVLKRKQSVCQRFWEVSSIKSQYYLIFKNVFENVTKIILVPFGVRMF